MPVVNNPPGVPPTTPNVSPTSPTGPVAPTGTTTPGATTTGTGTGTTTTTGTTPTPPLPPTTPGTASNVAMKLVTHEVIAAPTPEQIARGTKLLTEYGKDAVGPRHSRVGTQGADGSWPGCFMTHEVKAVADGMELWVYTANAEMNMKLNMSLQLKVESEGATQDLFINLTPKTPVVVNPTGGAAGFMGIQKYVIKTADVNAYLEQNAPQATGLRLKPGANLVVTAQWPRGHQWGSTNRDGVVKFQTAASSASGAAATQVSTTSSGDYVQDLAVSYDSTIKSRYPMLNVPNGAYQSHIEQESKVRAPLSKIKALYDQHMLLAAPKTPEEQKKASELMGKLVGGDPTGWTLKPLEDFLIKDASGAVKLDAHGMAELKQFQDLCADTANRDLSKRGLLVRWRQVDQQNLQTDTLNIKLWEPNAHGANGLPTAKPGNVNNRLETGSQMVRGTSTNLPEQTKLFADKSEPLNPINRIRELAPEIDVCEPGKPDSELRPSMQIVARRHKFDLSNATGFSVEKSLDVVMGMPLDRNGLPLKVDDQGVADPNGKFYAIGVFGNYEGELNHLNLPGTTTGTNNAALWGRNAVGTPTAVASNVRVNANNAAPGAGQEAWLAGLPPKAQVSGASRIHTYKDTQDPRGRAQADYKQFIAEETTFQEGMLGKLGDKDGAMPTEQKARMANLLAGTIPMMAAQRALYAEELAVSEKIRKHLPSVLDAPMAAAMQTLAQQEARLTQTKTQQEQYAQTAKTNGEANVKRAFDAAEARAKQQDTAGQGAAATATRTAAKTQHDTQMTTLTNTFNTQMRAANAAFSSQLETARAQVRAVAVKVLMTVNPLDFLS